ncbi:toxin-antitoxin system YwqK family antitoxin [Hymenobacter caeli]|uniref:Antitoxin component YwqK of YwqJK toxin-antitoxin module n=1 Tax=Hymenobacter caeli TaxID=2735894 RepID=A0ABX2FQP4_9BACT|nr:hypothetical protein [Hymenobacter caeli]NRT19173.1 antitoxin component YwqK of YwqJK toxin-antitoxin module [Hymenobacter caeli]
MPTFRWGAQLLVLLALAGACTRKTVSFNSRPDQAQAIAAADTLTHTADSLRGRPSLSTARRVAMGKAEVRAAKEKEKEAQRKPSKRKKIFLGERIKRGFAKSGGKGRNQAIEVFYYLKYFQQPNLQAPARYYYDPKKHKIFKAAAGELDPSAKILHGPYKKLQNNKVLETGFYALGVKHLRWERYDRNGTLLSKTHYEMGFPRDANITYFDAGRTQLKEVVPYVNGKLEGDYASYTATGQREWTGQFENGRRVGVWTNFWAVKKNFRHYEYQYPESGYDPEVEVPELLKEFTRNGVEVYDKEKNIDKRGEPEPSPTAPGRVPPARGHVLPKRAQAR